MKETRKRVYLAPVAGGRRVELEEEVAVPMSVGAMKAEVDEWDKGSSPTRLGDDAGEGGDAYWMWW
jgi:hypothetical protein